MLYNAMSMGKKTPKIAPSPWDFVNPQEDRATAIGKMHKNGKDRACGSGDMLARQTDTRTDTLITILRHSSSG